jgi:hypothetical protein
MTAREKFAKIYERDTKELKNDRKKSKNFFSLMYKGGPGSLLEIQIDTPSEYVAIPSFVKI